MRNNDLLKLLDEETKSLYKRLINNQNLDGKIELVGSCVFWERDGEITLNFDSQNFDIYINNKYFTHWHNPEYEQLCRIGEKNNIMVISKFLFLTSFYIGAKEDYKKKKGFMKKYGKKYYFGNI